MNNTIIPGISHTLSLPIHHGLRATDFALCGSAPAPAFATAILTGVMELACVETLRPYLKGGENSMGTHIYLSHAASPGAEITVTAELIEVRDQSLRFRVDCYDECGLIASGFHERKVINASRFGGKVRRKIGQHVFLAA